MFNCDQPILATSCCSALAWITFSEPKIPRPRSRSTLDCSLLVGLDVLSDGQRAFTNCTRDPLLKDCTTLPPSGQAVVELLETVEPDDLGMALRTLEGCRLHYRP